MSSAREPRRLPQTSTSLVPIVDAQQDSPPLPAAGWELQDPGRVRSAISYLILGVLIVAVALIISATIGQAVARANNAGAISTVTILVDVFVLCGVLVALVGGGYHLVLAFMHVRVASLSVKQVEQQMQHASERLALEKQRQQVEAHLALTRLAADDNGNHEGLILDEQRGIVYIPPPGQYKQPVPSSIHWSFRDTSKPPVVEEVPLQQLANVQAPTMEYIISQVPYNSLQVCLGVSATTGDSFTMDLVEGTHYRIIGGSGFGKSCEAAAILDQVTQTSDPDRLLIALLDLEHKTSRLFEHLPHVAQLPVGRKTIDCVATSPDEVAQHFGYLRSELDRRKALSEYDLEEERFLLIYVEEFLSLRREVDPDLLEQMMKDFSILALRGRKYKLYLLACAQVDYSDKSLREAMNQFHVNMSFCVKPSAARAAGFSSNELLKQNFQARQRGQFVLETTGCSDILLAPHYDVKAKLQGLASRSRYQVPIREDLFTSPRLEVVNSVNTPRTRAEQPMNISEQTDEHALQARLDVVRRLRSMGWGKIAIIAKVWGAKRGGTEKYKAAEAEYEMTVERLDSQEEVEG